MTTYTCNIEGLEFEIEAASQKDWNRRMNSYLIRGIRAEAGMSRNEFCDWLGIPYRTLQEWELGDRNMPEYVRDLIAYKVVMEKKAGNICRYRNGQAEPNHYRGYR